MVRIATLLTIMTILSITALPGLGSVQASEKLLTSEVDPYDTGIFSYRQQELLGKNSQVVFDQRIKVQAPESAEDSFNVPVTVDATAIPDVERIVMFVDYGPIPKILTFYPNKAEAKLSFRFKIDQATPIRAAVKTKTGSWHIGQTYIDAAGGGCTAPAFAYATNDWEADLGKVNASIWPDRGRLRMIVDHPMDTGLADGIPIFIIEHLQIDGPSGESLALIELHEPVNEDPAFTLYFPDGTLQNQVRIHGRDNNGNEIDATAFAFLTQ